MKNISIKEIETKSILTKSNLPISDFSVNPYVGCTHACKYCYACFMKRFTNHSEPWGEFLDVKYWNEIKNPSKYEGKEIFIGSATDPYNQYEEKYKRTRALLEQLCGCDIKISIQTKSDLVLRDIDLIKSFPNIRVGFSINTLDEEFKNDMDNAPSIEKRLNAMKILHEEGIRTTCFISPIFPEITDVEAIINRVEDRCNLIWLENLNLRGSFKADIMEYIKENHKELYPIYADIYNHNNRAYWEELDKRLKAFSDEKGLLYLRDDDSITPDFNAPPIIVNYFYHEEVKKSAKIKNRD